MIHYLYNDMAMAMLCNNPQVDMESTKPRSSPRRQPEHLRVLWHPEMIFPKDPWDEGCIYLSMNGWILWGKLVGKYTIVP